MEEKEARKRWKEHAYKACDDVVKGEYFFYNFLLDIYLTKKFKVFADCAKKNGVSVLWNCQEPKRQMNECILKLQKPEELDKQRELMIAEKIAKLEQEVKQSKK